AVHGGDPQAAEIDEVLVRRLALVVGAVLEVLAARSGGLVCPGVVGSGGGLPRLLLLCRIGRRRADLVLRCEVLDLFALLLPGEQSHDHPSVVVSTAVEEPAAPNPPLEPKPPSERSVSSRSSTSCSTGARKG